MIHIANPNVSHFIHICVLVVKHDIDCQTIIYQSPQAIEIITITTVPRHRIIVYIAIADQCHIFTRLFWQCL